MFGNMGQSPNGRSRHAMAFVGERVFVFGVESFTGSEADYPVNALNTNLLVFDPTADRRK